MLQWADTCCIYDRTFRAILRAYAVDIDFEALAQSSLPLYTRVITRVIVSQPVLSISGSVNVTVTANVSCAAL